MPIRSASDTKYLYYPVFHRVMQHNADGGKCLPTRIVSHNSGPFDFSAAAIPAAVTIKIKSDNGAWVNDTIDLSTVVSISAVTVAELVSKITASAITNLTAAAESVTGFLKLSLTTPGAVKYFQVDGEVAQYAGITALIFKGDTQKSIAVTPTMINSERLETIDSLGKRTAVVTSAYRTGSTPVIVDTAMSKELRAAIEGGTLTTVSGYAAKEYAAPGSESIQPIVGIETFYAIFAKNDNLETIPIGYSWSRNDSCKGTCGALAGDRNAQNWTYTFSAVPYRNPVTGLSDPTDEYIQELTTSEYAALDVFNV